MERLEPRIRWVWIVAAVVRTVILGTVLGGLLVALQAREVLAIGTDRILLGTVVLVILVSLVRTAVAWRRYAVFGFTLRDQSLYIERGVFTRIKTVVPYVRVQHVDSRRSPLERALGLGTLVVYTAGSRNADVAIPGLTPDRAEALQERLRELTIETNGEDAV
ncbi:PH domain-containing protein [Natronosalvus rutilus]|uniref:PH domain-containing protein n=1 Tax=Natronosalvus rutilus TaxID=2953753 RepID=A0A9E7SUP2_9EURY|nr:PH domain-containing protein [Natronosalvus rutilus]UTF53082.1 PH domain-containing protein [Natronosalvus rutilus]